MKYIKRAIDVVMLLLWIYLMGYRGFWGLLFHAIGGIGLFILFIAHNVLNRAYWRALLRGRYSIRRKVLAVTNIALFIAMVLMAISAMLMSGAVFYYSPFPMTYAGLCLHKLSTAWGYMIMAVHLSLHTSALWTRLYTSISRAIGRIAYCVLLMLLTLVGVWGYYKSRIWVNMFLVNTDKAVMGAWGTSGEVGSPLGKAAGYLAIVVGTMAIVALVNIAICHFRGQDNRC